jgi:DNA polymerase III delta prime subunit
MFEDLLLHAHTRRRLEALPARPGHAYGFAGATGSGKLTTARRLADLWSGGDSGLVHSVESAGSSIGIAEIHALRPLLGQQVPAGVRRVIIIDGAERLTHEAQNSLLKALEEPARQTTFILTVTEPARLLATVRSRLQLIQFHHAAEGEFIGWLMKGRAELGENEARRLYHVGDRTPGGALTALASGDRESMELARRFLTADAYERSIVIGQIQKTEKQAVGDFLRDLSKLLAAAMRAAIRRDRADEARRLAAKLRAVLGVIADLNRNVNQRLLLSRLVVEL